MRNEECDGVPFVDPTDLKSSGSVQWRWAILCDHLEVNKSQSSTKLFIFGSASPILHKVPTKPV